MSRYIGIYLLVELIAMVALVSWIGFLPTVLLMAAGGLVGLALVRREGIRAAIALAEAAQARRIPHAEVTDGALVGLAGLLILLPGVVSDLAGLLLVLPPTRALVRGRIVARAERRAPGLSTSRIRDGHTVVDGDVVYGPRGSGAAGSGAAGEVQVFDAGGRPWVWDEPSSARPLDR